MATPTQHNPLGAKGAGEVGAVGAAAAIGNAVVDALSDLGVKHVDMPYTPEKLWRILRKNGQHSPARSNGGAA
jgi:carbon-monoxide dehydrogenase large subunit